MNTEKMIGITDKALTQIKSIMANDEGSASQPGIRLGVVGGGCSGLNYKIELGDFKEKDNILEFDDIKVYVDPKSSIYLKGTILDFKDGLQGKGFVFNNPNATNTCGCGESFAV